MSSNEMSLVCRAIEVPKKEKESNTQCFAHESDLHSWFV